MLPGIVKSSISAMFKPDPDQLPATTASGLPLCAKLNIIEQAWLDLSCIIAGPCSRLKFEGRKNELNNQTTLQMFTDKRQTN